MATFNIEMMFSMRCETNGYTIEAENLEKARELVLSCISKDDGGFNFEKFAALGGETVSWSICNGTDHDYALNEVVEDAPSAAA